MRIFYGTIIFGLLCSGMLWATAADRPQTIFFDPELNRAAQVNLDTLQESAKNLQTVDEVLKLLPEEFHSQYLVIRDSASFQKSQPPVKKGDIVKPRIISYGGQGLIASFTHPNLPGGDAIEFLQVTPQNTWVTAEFKEGRGFEINPQKCVQCHGSPTRPIWEGYPCWPQAYAGQDDRLNTSEWDELNAFGAEIKSHPSSRYAFLHGFKKRYLTMEDQGPVGARLKSVPNTNFVRYVHAFDDIRTLREIKKIPHYNELKYAITAALWGCAYDPMTNGGLAPMFSPEVWKNKIEPLFLKIKSSWSAYYDHKYGDPKRRVCESSSGVGENEILLYTLLESQGVPTYQLFTSLDPSDPTFFSHPDDSRRVQSLAEYLALSDPDLKVYIPLSYYGSCDKLRAQSALTTQFFNEFPAPPLSNDFALVPNKTAMNQKTAATFSKCLVCHAQGLYGAPLVPFSNFQELRQWFQEDPSRIQNLKERISENPPADVNKMPLVGGLQNFERDAITNFLQQLVRY